MRAIAGVIVMSALLLLYFGLAGARAIALLQTGTPITVAMGVALIVLPVIGAWALVRELIFGASATKLVDRLAAEGNLPEEEFATKASGRPVREDADRVFPKYKAEVESDESSWRAWLRLGIIYDACADRKRARAAVRKAIALEKLDK